ncbi:hypothetical protein PCC9214_03955 [Planktothrix tepida]|uniref:Ice-binding protein C-terminal domain-containing protein n=2 Tax=Planktothrix TaxID=54304 RepID=A0A1J1LQZ2_9CYAN|nr:MULTISPECIES: PEP-CTERM sorting domain-containing protein [Planktothrix]CAD5937314.1 hypothetical protein NO713_01684 [Planktothrix pseudagardhii]CAD5973085.1 hypothetical protein PCC9214_03955 [Planktothrix tepida]CUR34434.1 exported hypothetical protein [Planktothrix tepida PCC 9214]
MSTQTIRKLALFCLTSAALSGGAMTTASSAIAGPIDTWDLVSTFDFYFLNPNLFYPPPTYKLVIDVAGYTADNKDNLFNNVDISPLATSMTYFQVKGAGGFTSHTDTSFLPSGTNLFSAELQPAQDNTLGALNISSMKLDIKRTASNLFNLTLFSTDANNIPKIFAYDTNVSFNHKGSVPEPSTVLGLLGLSAFSLKVLKKTQKN